MCIKPGTYQPKTTNHKVVYGNNICINKPMINTNG